MTSRSLTVIPAAVLLLLAGTFSLPAAVIFGLGESGGNVFSFDSAAPGTVINPQTLTGLPAGQSARAIDFRPSNGVLYLLSTGSTTSDARLLTVNLLTGGLTNVGSLTLPGATGLRHSMDWNPVTDRLHIISSASRTQYEVNPLTMEVTVLTPFASGTAYSGLAFDNNTAGSPSTTAWLYDYAADELRRSSSLGTAVTTAVGNPFGANSSNTASQGFDISGTGTAYFNTDLFDGPLSGTGDRLFSFNLTTAAATDLGAIGLPTLDISAQPIPEPSVPAGLVVSCLLLLRRPRCR
jgi:hypothetical protein